MVMEPQSGPASTELINRLARMQVRNLRYCRLEACATF
jgi:hypothetical protein